MCVNCAIYYNVNTVLDVFLKHVCFLLCTFLLSSVVQENWPRMF